MLVGGWRMEGVSGEMGRGGEGRGGEGRGGEGRGGEGRGGGGEGRGGEGEIKTLGTATCICTLILDNVPT